MGREGGGGKWEGGYRSQDERSWKREWLYYYMILTRVKYHSPLYLLYLISQSFILIIFNITVLYIYYMKYCNILYNIYFILYHKPLHLIYFISQTYITVFISNICYLYQSFISGTDVDGEDKRTTCTMSILID